MLTPYKYQDDYEVAIREAFKTHTRVILAAPTGSGKTVMFTSFVSKSTRKGKRCLVLTDRIELFKQSMKAFSRSDMDVQICEINKDNRLINNEALLFVGMVETFKRRMSSLQHLKFDLIICDEAHKSAFFPILDLYQNTYTIGATATPINPRLHKYYTNLIQLIDVPELIEKGFLAPCRAFQMQDDVSDIKVKTNGEYEEKSHFKHFNKSKLYNGLIDKWLEKTPLQKTLVYCVNIEHSIITTEAFNARGIKARCITSKTKDVERDAILFDFDKGMFPVLVNCGVLTTGTDIPSVEVIAVNRAISSLALWLQIVGRGGRIYPGKEFFTCLDFGMNHSKHGLWQLPRTWTLEPPKKKKSGGGVAPIKLCTQCEAIVATSTTICPHCGFLFPNKTDQLREGELVEVGQRLPENLINKNISELSVNELIELERCGRFKPAYIWRIVRTRGEYALGEYAMAKGYKDGWVRNQLELMDGGSVGFSNVLIS